MASVNFKEGLSPGALGVGPGSPGWHGTGRGHWAVCHAPEPSAEELTGQRLRREAPGLPAQRALLAGLRWEGLRQVGLLPCRSAAG